MNRFNINLSSRPFHNNTLHWTVFSLILTALIAFTWYDIHRFSVSGAEKEAWSAALSERRHELTEFSLEAETINAHVSRMDLASLHERSSFANGIILSRLFSWSTLFGRLEEIQPELVRIKAIRPVVSSERIDVDLEGTTTNPESLLQFEEALLASEYFALVYPVRESSQQKRDEIEFSVSFSYIPEGKRARKTSAAPAIDLDQLFQERPGEEEEPPAGAGTPESAPAPEGAGDLLDPGLGQEEDPSEVNGP